MKFLNWMRSPRGLGLCGASMVSLVLLLALFAPVLSPQDPNYMSLSERFASPSIKHPFGLDENGSDVFAKVAYGARISLGVGITVVVVSLFVGLIVGSLAGVLGGWIDGCICGFINIVYSFPSFLLALALIAMLGPSIKNVIIAMCLSSWTGYARLVRGEILHLRERDFIQTVKALGGSRLRQTVIHIWPNLTGPLMVHSTFAIAGTIIAESGLSFLGLGAPPTSPTWGALLNAGRRVLTEAPHISLFPGSAILILVLGFNLIGDGLRDYLDPRRTDS